MKCRSTFVRRDLLLRHDRTVHAKDGGVPLHSDAKRRAGGPKTRAATTPSKAKLALDTSALEQMEVGNDGLFDVEEAAMLVADLHHKATAAMREEAASMAYSSHGASLMEPAVTYPSGVIALPQVQWDGFVSASDAEPRAHSIASSASGSFETPSFAPGMITTQARVSQLAPIADESDGANMPPTFQSMVQALPRSGMDASILSPSVVDAHVGFKIPQVFGDEQRNAILENIRICDREQAVPGEFRLPGLGSLNRYLSTYFTLFHPHLPFLHPSSFDPSQVSAPLILAALSIGALYAFDQDQAYMLHIGSKVLVNQFLQNKENFSSRKCPLWAMQSSLLNMVFASWSGDPKGLEWTCSMKSLLANMIAGNRYELKLRQEARGSAKPTRLEWVEDEGCRRTYYAVYIFFGLLTLTYNHTPAISFNEFEDLQLPASEALWCLQGVSDASWPEYLAQSTVVTFMEAHEKLFQGEKLRYSVFATRVMINALFLEVWYHKRSPEALQDVVTEYKLRLALETWDKSLDHCEPESVAIPLNASATGHPLLFNAKAMFRNARARLEVDLKCVQEALRYHDPYEVAAAMSQARDRVKRSSEMIKVIQECFDCIQTAVVQGVRWVARTSPTHWSVEHPLCGLDMMIILSLWLYRLEHDEEPATPEEVVMYNKVRQLFANDLDEIYMSQMSSVVARFWGSLLDEVVVWG